MRRRSGTSLLKVEPLTPRSYLFVPGNRPERFSKALASGADSVIIDLEDAVPPNHKAAARETVRLWLSAHSESANRRLVLRINAADTPWFTDDLALCRLPGVAAVMLAKTESPEHLGAFSDAPPIIALIESAFAFENLRAIARNSRWSRASPVCLRRSTAQARRSITMTRWNQKPGARVDSASVRSSASIRGRSAS